GRSLRARPSSSPLRMPPGPQQYTVRCETERLLATGKKVAMKRLDGGSTFACVVALDNGLSGIFKPDVAFWPNDSQFNREAGCAAFEVLAYEIDKRLGFGGVPPTIRRTIDGMRGSFQLFIPGRTLYDLRGAAPIAAAAFQSGVSRFPVRNALIGQVDHSP